MYWNFFIYATFRKVNIGGLILLWNVNSNCVDIAKIVLRCQGSLNSSDNNMDIHQEMTALKESGNENLKFNTQKSDK